MPTYGVKHPDDDQPFLTMEADGPDDHPTKCSGDLADYAQELVEKFGANVRAVASRMGTMNQLVVIEDGVSKEVSMQSLEDMIASARANLRRTDPENTITEVGKDSEVELLADGTIAKADDETRNIFGWAYVTHDTNGQVNIDKSGDFIDAVEEIEKSAYDFVLTSRNGDFDHTNVKSAEMIESMVFTPEKIEKMGLAPGSVPLGWWIGFHFENQADWEIAKTKKAFSIHGSGTRAKVAD